MSAKKVGRPIEILLVEDNPGDVRLTKEALKEAKMANHLSVVVDGEAAMAFLRREGEFADAARPDLILLDLNLPKMSGREVLADVKNDERLRRKRPRDMFVPELPKRVVEAHDVALDLASEGAIVTLRHRGTLAMGA